MTDEFDLFWDAFPKKKAKGDCRKAWKQTQKIRPPITELLAAIKAASHTEQWMRDDGQFIPYPATWLRREQWTDEHKVVLKGVVNEKPWQETASGIEAKGAELGLHPSQFDNWQLFKHAVLRKNIKVA